MYILSCSVVSDSSDSVDCSLPGPSVRGIFQARILEWVPFSCLGELASPGTELANPASLSLADRFFTTEPPGSPVKPKSNPVAPQLKICSGPPLHSEETQTLSHDLPGPTHLVLGLFSKLTSL